MEINSSSNFSQKWNTYNPLNFISSLEFLVDILKSNTCLPWKKMSSMCHKFEFPTKITS